jgi:hypothetical protein
MEGNTLMEKVTHIVKRDDVIWFAEMVSTLDVSKYNNQKEWREIIKRIYWEVFINDEQHD